MERKISLTAAELYFLGRLMQAKYIDYSYISMMNDIERNYRFAESKALDSLEKKSIISEDFGGDVSVEEDYKKLFDPVFFGRSVASAELLIPIESGNCSFNKFHYKDGRLTLANITRKRIVFSEYDKRSLESFLLSIAGNLSEDKEPASPDEDIVTSPDRVILLKYTSFGEESMVIQLNIYKKRLYIIKDKGSYEPISISQYIGLGTLILGGELNGTEEH